MSYIAGVLSYFVYFMVFLMFCDVYSRAVVTIYLFIYMRILGNVGSCRRVYFGLGGRGGVALILGACMHVIVIIHSVFPDVVVARRREMPTQAQSSGFTMINHG